VLDGPAPTGTVTANTNPTTRQEPDMRVHTTDNGTRIDLTPAETAELRMALPNLASRVANTLAEELATPAPGTVAITLYTTPCGGNNVIAADALLGVNTDPLAATLLLRAGFADPERQGDPTATRFHTAATDGHAYANTAANDALGMLRACNIKVTVAETPTCGHL
jgi:hypothetical protein